MKKKKYKRGKGIYIAGPMTGYVNYNAEAFNRTETLLRVGEGVPIVNPSRIVMSIYKDEDSIKKFFNYYRFIDVLKGIMKRECSTIALLPGWEDSNGAKIELEFALKHGFKVMLISHADIKSDLLSKLVKDN